MSYLSFYECEMRLESHNRGNYGKNDIKKSYFCSSMVKVRKYERMYESNFNCDSTFWLVVCFLGLCSCECIHCDNFLGEIVLSLRLFNDIVLFVEELEVREIDILTETFSEE